MTRDKFFKAQAEVAEEIEDLEGIEMLEAFRKVRLEYRGRGYDFEKDDYNKQIAWAFSSWGKGFAMEYGQLEELPCEYRPRGQQGEA